MALSLVTDVLVVCMDQVIEPGLAQSASHHGWPMFKSATMAQTMRRVHLYRPHVVIVQMPTEGSQQETLDLIRLLRIRGRRLWLVAVAGQHSESTERAVREAGASVYLSSGAQAELIDQAIDAILSNAGREDSSWFRRSADARSEDDTGRANVAAS